MVLQVSPIGKRPKIYNFEDYQIKIFPDEGGFIAIIPELPSISAWGKTAIDAKNELKEVFSLVKRIFLEDKQDMPTPLKFC